MSAASSKLTLVATFPRMRALFWADNLLYASRGYNLMCARMDLHSIGWEPVAQYRPEWWRNVTSSTSLSSRLCRDGFHALAKLPTGQIIAAVPGAIATLHPGETAFRVSHRLGRGTRPLHIASAPDSTLYWGEYFDNPLRDTVHIYRSIDFGENWKIAYTFPQSAVRHVHNIVHDPWQNCLWILTGDNGPECRILRASYDLQSVETVLSGSQQARAVAAVPTEQGLTFSSDTPLEGNFVYRIDCGGKSNKLANLAASSIYGCRVGNHIFFSTMVEPSQANREQSVFIYGEHLDGSWHRELAWKKDPWPLRYFQYGNAMLPDGNNSTDLLAVSTTAVQPGDGTTFIYRVQT